MNDKLKIRLYENMLQIRYFEEKVEEGASEDKTHTSPHLCIGQEASAVGACSTLEENDNITTTHRGHGHCLAMGIDCKKLLAEIYGKETGTNTGRGGSLHITQPSKGVLGATGVVGAGIPIAVGAGLSSQVKGTETVTICFFGDGASNTGAFHEGLNMASVWDLPVVFLCENNQYGQFTSYSDASRINNIAERAESYGIPGLTLDGMDCLEVHEGTKKAVNRARRGDGPTLVECKTYRYRGHFMGDSFGYRSDEEIKKWKENDPIEKMRGRLFEEGILDEEKDQEIKEKVSKEIEEAAEFAEDSRYPEPADLSREDVYAPVQQVSNKPRKETFDNDRELTCREAINEALQEEFENNENVVLYGEDVAHVGGVFGCTKGLQDRFGSERVRDTPISEEAIIGSGLGAAMTGLRPVVEIEYMDFIHKGMDSLCNELAKFRFMSGGKIETPVVVRTAAGSQYPMLGRAAQHSQDLSAWFVHTPGLKVITYSTPREAKGLLKAAIRDDNPVLFIEHKLLYFGNVSTARKNWPRIIGHVPEEEYILPLGEADIKREGEDVTIISNMLMVHKALNAAQRLEENDSINAEVVDLRSLSPLDTELIEDSVKKTGKAVVVSEGPKSCGVASEVASVIGEKCIFDMEAPIRVVSRPNLPVPYGPTLGKKVIPDEKGIEEAVMSLF